MNAKETPTPAFLQLPGAGALAEAEKRRRETGDRDGGGDGERFVPVYRTQDQVEFQGSALAKRLEMQRGDDSTAPAELSTVESTVNQGVKASLRTIHEAMLAIRCHEIWNDWSPASRDLRNKKAGHKNIGL